MSHIFISYSRANIEFVRYLRAHLQDANLPVWMDELGLEAGVNWWKSIEQNIDCAGAVVVIMTPTAEASEYVQNEVLRALNKQVPIYPVWLSGEGFSLLATRHWEDMRAGLDAPSPSKAFLSKLQSHIVVEQRQNPGVVRFEIQHGDARDHVCDVLLLKYAKAFYGAYKSISRILKGAGITIDQTELATDTSHLLLDTKHAIEANKTLILGTKFLFGMTYEDIQRHGELALEVLRNKAPETDHIGMTLHSKAFGLDEEEALLAMIRGITSALAAKTAPSGLSRITIIESDQERYEKTLDILSTIFERCDNATAVDSGGFGFDLTVSSQSKDDIGSSSQTKTLTKPMAIVLMSDRPENRDLFYYGIEKQVKAGGLLCERMEPHLSPGETRDDPSYHLQNVLQRIRQARLFVADVTETTPELMVKIGCAWGANIPVFLFSYGRDPDSHLFDRQVVTCHRIRDLEQGFSEWKNKVDSEGQTSTLALGRHQDISPVPRSSSNAQESTLLSGKDPIYYEKLDISTDQAHVFKAFQKASDGSKSDVSICRWACLMNHHNLDCSQRNILILNEILKTCPFEAFRFETKGCNVDNYDQKSFEFALVNDPFLANVAATADPSPFREHLASGKNPVVASFKNLGRDARLVVPKAQVATENRNVYGHLASFARGGPVTQIVQVWRFVAQRLLGRVESGETGQKTAWLSTCGTGVAWLQFRFDSRPKYYLYTPFAEES